MVLEASVIWSVAFLHPPSQALHALGSGSYEGIQDADQAVMFLLELNGRAAFQNHPLHK